MNDAAERMPLSVILALSGWVIVVAFFLWVGIGSIQGSQWGGFVFWLFPASAAGAALWGLSRRTLRGWYWSRCVSHLFGMFSTIPFVFALGYIGFRFAGGRVEDQMSYVASVLAFVGFFLIVPAVAFWSIYFATNTESAKRYFRVCPHCAKRIKAPIQLLFSDIHCNECRLTTDRRGS